MNLKILIYFLLLSIGISFGVEFNITNNHKRTVWIGIHSNDNGVLEKGGFKLEAGASRIVETYHNWVGRIWARTFCNDDTERCQTGDCFGLHCNGLPGAPPVTYIEMRLKGYADLDFYGVSLESGFNSIASIKPINGNGTCPAEACKKDLNVNCPKELQVHLDGNTTAPIIACKSPCFLRDEPEYCCSETYGTPGTCNLIEWITNMNSAMHFEGNCPQAYTRSFVYHVDMFTCASDRYDIEFG